MNRDPLKNFRGMRFSKEDKAAITNRITKLLKEGCKVDTMRTIMQAEGFRRVDGSDLTTTWVGQWVNKVRKPMTKAATPGKVVYNKPAPRPASTELVPIHAMANSPMSDEALGQAVRALLG